MGLSLVGKRQTAFQIVAKDFAENGAEAIERVRREDPAMYLRIVGSLVPRELIAKREEAPDFDYAQLTDEQAGEIIAAERRRRFIETSARDCRKSMKLTFPLTPHAFQAS
jgi:hypothetical protein